MPRPLIVAVDFDGTIVEHEYPDIGAPVPGAIETMKELSAMGVKLILWTMRSGDELAAAVKYCEELGVDFFGINENPGQSSWTTSPKAYAHIYVDDAAAGCPMIPTKGRPAVNWEAISSQLLRAAAARVGDMGVRKP